MATIKIPFTPRDYQNQIINDPHPFKIVVFHRQSGKTTTALNILNKEAILNPGTYLYIAPEKSQAKNIIWKDSEGIFKYVPYEFIASKNDVELTIKFKPTKFRESGRPYPGSIFMIEGSDNPDRVRGLKPRGAILDEYDQIDESLWETLFPALNQNGGWAIIIGTFKGKGRLYDLFSKYWDWQKMESIDDPYFKAFYLPAHLNKFFTPEMQVKAKSVMSPSMYAQEYELQPMDGAGRVFPSITDLMVGGLRPRNKYHFYTMGVDLGKSVDYTAVSIIDRNTHELVYQERWQAEWSTTVEKILTLRKQYNNAHIVIDSTGLGDPIAEILRKRGVGRSHIEDFKFSTKSKDQLIKKMAVFFSEGRVILPPWDQIQNLASEIEQYTYEILPSGNYRYTAPQGRHDDEVMSLGLAMWPLQDTPIKELYQVGTGTSETIELDPF